MFLRLPDHNLRALEYLFTRAYERSQKFGVKLVRIDYLQQSIVITLRKEVEDNIGIF